VIIEGQGGSVMKMKYILLYFQNLYIVCMVSIFDELLGN
jgi:hypothetical protein